MNTYKDMCLTEYLVKVRAKALSEKGMSIDEIIELYKKEKLQKKIKTSMLTKHDEEMKGKEEVFEYFCAISALKASKTTSETTKKGA